MNKLYTALLNVSKYYNDQTISNLVSKVSFIGKSEYSNNDKTIHIHVNRTASMEDDDTIRQVLKEWLNTLPADKEDIRYICDNVQYIFNITKMTYANIPEHTICIWLY